MAIVLNLPERLCHDRNQGRPERSFGPHVARQQSQSLRRSLRHLKDEGFRHVFVLSSPEEVESELLEPQEQVLQGLAGLEELDGNAGPGGSFINLTFAIGTDMNSPMGGTYPGPGIVLGTGLTFGYIAARSIIDGHAR